MGRDVIYVEEGKCETFDHVGKARIVRDTDVMREDWGNVVHTPSRGPGPKQEREMCDWL